MFKIIAVTFTLLFSVNVMAIDFSGSYYGIKCKGNPKCVDPPLPGVTPPTI